MYEMPQNVSDALKCLEMDILDKTGIQVEDGITWDVTTHIVY